MTTKTQYGYPISSIFIQICAMVLLVILIVLTIVSGFFKATIGLVAISFLFWYFGIYQFRNRFSQLRSTILDQMKSYAQLKDTDYILDLGTGAGYVAIGFANNVTSGLVVGVDKYDQGTRILGQNFLENLKINFFNNKLEQAKQNVSLEHQEDSIVFIKSDLKKKFPFFDRSFNLVLSSQFLYCIPIKDLNKVLSEIDRVLKPSGQLVFFESEKFLNWNVSKVQSFFKKLQYSTERYHLEKMKNKSIFVAKKP